MSVNDIVDLILEAKREDTNKALQYVTLLEHFSGLNGSERKDYPTEEEVRYFLDEKSANEYTEWVNTGFIAEEFLEKAVDRGILEKKNNQEGETVYGPKIDYTVETKK